MGKIRIKNGSTNDFTTRLLTLTVGSQVSVRMPVNHKIVSESKEQNNGKVKITQCIRADYFDMAWSMVASKAQQKLWTRDSKRKAFC